MLRLVLTEVSHGTVTFQGHTPWRQYIMTVTDWQDLGRPVEIEAPISLVR